VSRPLTPSSDDSPESDHEPPQGGSGRHMPLEDEYPPATLPKIRTSLEFIRMVKEATLATQFSPEDLAEFLNPREHASVPSDDPVLRFSL